MTEPLLTTEVLSLPVLGARNTLGDHIDLRDLLTDGHRIAEPIRYSDTFWDFTGYPFVNQTVTYLDFADVPVRWQPAVKDWVLLRLNPDLARTGDSGLHTSVAMAEVAAHDKVLKVPSAAAYIHCLGASLAVLDNLGYRHLGAAEWNQFAAAMRRTYPNATAGTLAGYARPLISFWAYRSVLGLPEDLFGGTPFNGRTVEQLFKVPDRFLNATRPNADLCGPLLGLALWMLDHCAEDVLVRLEALADVPDRTDLSREEQDESVLAVLLEHERSGRPMPGLPNLRTGELVPGWSAFVRLAGCSTKALNNPNRQAGKVFKRLAEERPVSVHEDGFGLPINTVPDATGNPVPWVDSLPLTKFGIGLDFWAPTLAYACTLIITMLTTVRDRELAALPHDCLRFGTYERGDVDVPVARMSGYLIKNRDQPIPTTWVIADDVTRAVQVLHRLKAAQRLRPKFHPATGKEVLLHPDLGRSRGHEKEQDTLTLQLGWLGWFRTASAHFAQRGLTPPLPDLPDWLSHRTLRITGIQSYASQAWGEALAAAQAHWSNRTVAEGYLGHLPRSVYLADPEAIEEAVDSARTEALLDIATSIEADPTAVAGGGADRLRHLLEQTEALDLANAAVTQRQLNGLARDTKHVFVGELTVCVQGPGGLCGSEDEADWLLCRPFACRNSAMTRAQRARLELRRRGWARRDGVFQRARSKIEQDAPDIEAEFAELDDAAVRSLVLDDLPFPIARAALEDPTT